MIRKGRFNKPAAEIAQRYGDLFRLIGVFIATRSQDRSHTPQRSPAQRS
jgi:hypothetical protein